MLKMCKKYENNIGVQPILGDIRDRKILSSVFSSFDQMLFFMLQHINTFLCKNKPWEAVQTNIQGTINLVECSEVYEVERFVLVSTDKAVNPTNVMGASKRVAEQVIQAMRLNVKYMAVRFGNVIGSSGSVIPTFQEQIKQWAMAITDPNIKRYFMSIPEAAQLILRGSLVVMEKYLFWIWVNQY